MSDRLRIGIHIDFETSYYRRVMVGIRQYLSEHRGIRTTQIGLPLNADKCRKSGPFDGFIALILDRETGEQLRSLNPKVLSVTSATPIRSMPVVSSDDRAVGKMACDHLIRQGYRNLLFVGGEFEYGKLRLEGARIAAEAKGLSVRQVNCVDHEPKRVVLKELPTGIVCDRDSIAFTVIKQLQREGYRIPEDAAIVGSDDDDLVTALSDIPLSTVKLDKERVGYEAMRIMHEWIQGSEPPVDPVLIPPLEFIGRASSGVQEVRDPRVKAWLAFLEEHLPEIPNVAELSARIGVSRRVLERKFREVLGCSVYGKITRMRIQKANTLMRNSSLTLGQISEACGFGDARTFSLAYKRVEGMPPSARRQVMLGKQKDADPERPAS